MEAIDFKPGLLSVGRAADQGGNRIPDWIELSDSSKSQNVLSEIEEHLVDGDDEVFHQRQYSKRLPPGFMVKKFKDDFLVAKAYFLSEFCKKVVHGHDQVIHYRGEDEIMQGLDDYLIENTHAVKIIHGFFTEYPQYTKYMSKKYTQERNQVHQFLRTLLHMDNENLHAVVKAYVRVWCGQELPMEACDVLRKALVSTVAETHDPWGQ